MSAVSDVPVSLLGSEKDDRGPAFRGFVILLVIITVTAITLRFWSRSMGTPHFKDTRRFWWDDWLALAAVPFILTLCILCFVLVDLGLGHRIWAIPPENLALILKLLFASHFAWDAAVYLAKESALLFLRRIFPKANSTTAFNIALWVTHGLNSAWVIGIVLGAVLRCDPVALNWNPTLPGTCGSLQGAWLGTAIPSLIVDLIILLLPMPTIWGLRTNASRKFGLTIILALGYCVCIVTIGRLVTIGMSKEALETDITYDGMPALFWLAADAPITLLSICLPAMLSLYNRIISSYITPLVSKFSLAWTSGSRSGLIRSKSGEWSQPKNHDGSPWAAPTESIHRIHDPGAADTGSVYSKGNRCEVLRGAAGNDRYSVQVRGEAINGNNYHNIPLRSIRIDHDVEVNSLY